MLVLYNITSMNIQRLTYEKENKHFVGNNQLIQSTASKCTLKSFMINKEFPEQSRNMLIITLCQKIKQNNSEYDKNGKDLFIQIQNNSYCVPRYLLAIVWHNSNIGRLVKGIFSQNSVISDSISR